MREAHTFFSMKICGGIFPGIEARRNLDLILKTVKKFFLRVWSMNKNSRLQKPNRSFFELAHQKKDGPMEGHLR
jgi:hypothetical protein